MKVSWKVIFFFFLPRKNGRISRTHPLPNAFPQRVPLSRITAKCFGRRDFRHPTWLGRSPFVSSFFRISFRRAIRSHSPFWRTLTLMSIESKWLAQSYSPSPPFYLLGNDPRMTSSYPCFAVLRHGLRLCNCRHFPTSSVATIKSWVCHVTMKKETI